MILQNFTKRKKLRHKENKRSAGAVDTRNKVSATDRKRKFAGTVGVGRES